MDEVGRGSKPVRQRLRPGQLSKERAEDGPGGTAGEDEQALGQPGEDFSIRAAQGKLDAAEGRLHILAKVAVAGLAIQLGQRLKGGLEAFHKGGEPLIFLALGGQLVLEGDGGRFHRLRTA